MSDTALDKRGGQVGAEDGAVIQARADELRRVHEPPAPLSNSTTAVRELRTPYAHLLLLRESGSERGVAPDAR